MATSTRVAAVLLRYLVDASSISKTVRANHQVQRALDDTTKRAISTSKAGDEITRAFAETARTKALDRIPVLFREIEKETGDTEKAIYRVQQALSALGASESEVKKSPLQSLKRIAAVGEAVAVETSLG